MTPLILFHLSDLFHELFSISLLTSCGDSLQFQKLIQLQQTLGHAVLPKVLSGILRDFHLEQRFFFHLQSFIRADTNISIQTHPLCRKMALFTLLFLLFFCGLGLAVDDPPKVVESLSGIPQGWSQVLRQPMPLSCDRIHTDLLQGNAPAPTEMLKLRLAMDQPLVADFHQLVHNISTPDHASYGNHLSKREVDNLSRPSSEASNAITAWLEGAGVESQSIILSGHWIMFDTTVAIADALLDTKFYYYHDGSVSLIRTLQYSVPSSLRTMIQKIQPSTGFGQPQDAVA